MLRARGSRRETKDCVQFIQRGIAYSDQKCDDGLIKSPATGFGSNTMKNSDAKNTEFRDLCRLSNSEMHRFQRVPARGREEFGLLGTEIAVEKREIRRPDQRALLGSPPGRKA